MKSVWLAFLLKYWILSKMTTRIWINIPPQSLKSFRMDLKFACALFTCVLHENVTTIRSDVLSPTFKYWIFYIVCNAFYWAVNKNLRAHFFYDTLRDFHATNCQIQYLSLDARKHRQSATLRSWTQVLQPSRSWSLFVRWRKVYHLWKLTGQCEYKQRENDL